MQAMQAQVQAVTEELGALKNEIVNLKAAHAGLHQTAVDSSLQTGRTIEAIQAKIAELPNLANGKRPTLMEPKQVNVEEFSGGVADSRNKFIEWTERVRDRVLLFDPALAEEMKKVEGASEVIDKAANDARGITPQANRELQVFIKDKTGGIAGSIVRSHKEGIALESWRLLWSEFCPTTLTSTMKAQQLDKFPKSANKWGSSPKGC